MKNPVNTPTASWLMLFGSLSRTQHSVMELATPGLAALLWLGYMPDPFFIALGLLTAFAGYTSVYALNDIVDFRADRERTRSGGFQDTEIVVEKGLIRHPLAKGQLSLAGGLAWAGLWGIVALIGAWILNPVCALIFILGASLEAVYCLLLKVTPMRAFVHGVVKTSGAVAAVFAATPNPSPLFLAVLFFWIYFWEVGGQNIPNDWHDLDEDRSSGARTIPVCYGTRAASLIVMVSLCISVALSVILFLIAPAGPSAGYTVTAAAAGTYLLLVPAWRLMIKTDRTRAGSLFSRATLYQPAVFIIVVLHILTSP